MKKNYLFILCFFSLNIILGQLAGELDQSFNFLDLGKQNYFSGVTTDYGKITAIVTQSDGKILIGGYFSSYNGVSRNGIARLHPDGSLDTSFNPGIGVNDPNGYRIAYVNSIAVLSDGKILIAGNFQSFNGVNRKYIAKLNADGSLDTSFDSPFLTGTRNIVKMEVLVDGKIIVGGFLKHPTNYLSPYYGWVWHEVTSSVIRLNSDGTIDHTFIRYKGAEKNDEDECKDLHVQPDGKVIFFIPSYSNNPDRLLRLNADGSLDSSFNKSAEYNFDKAIITQSDGKILIGGNYKDNNNITLNTILRLNSNGTLDSSFIKGEGTRNYSLKVIAIQQDGKILIAGNFLSFNGISRFNLARVNNDGSIDSSFNAINGAWIIEEISQIKILNDGKILVAVKGKFGSFIVKLNSDGSLDSNFVQQTGANEQVRSIVIKPSGKILIGGDFTLYNGIARNGFAQLNSDGSIDKNFNAGVIGPGSNGSVSSIYNQSDGKIIIGGGFYSYNGVERIGMARLNSDGALDESFVPPGLHVLGYIQDISMQLDGKYIVLTEYKKIKRLHVNGSEDVTFNPPNSTSGYTYSCFIQPDGKIIIGGSFNKKLVRINPDNSVDASFNPIIPSAVVALSMQSDGKILFSSMYNQSFFVGRLNADGSKDSSFNETIISNNWTRKIVPQSDGKILVFGDFTMYNGVLSNNIARLNSDGTFDNSFNSGNGAVGIKSIALQSDGKILLGGSFTSYNNISKNRLVRILDKLTTPQAPTGNSQQSFCGNATIANLQVVGNNIKWYSLSSGGVLLNSNIVLTNGSTYYATQTISNLESTSRLAVTVSINPLPSSAGVITGIATVCQGQNNVLFTVPTIANSTSYEWVLPNGSSGSSTTNSINVSFGVSAVSGNVTVKGVNSCGMGTASSFAVNVLNCSLPATNFKLEVFNPTCQTKTNGKLKITATATYNYTATMDGKDYTFTNNVLEVADLAPKVYTVCVKVPALNNYTQCFDFEVKAASGLGARTSLDTKGNSTAANIEIESGTAPYIIEVNGKTMEITYDKSISVAVENGDLLVVKSSLACEGSISEKVILFNELTAYPNPTSDYVQVFIPTTYQKSSVMVQLVNNIGKTVLSKAYNIQDNKIVIPMEYLPMGLYMLHIQLEKPQTIKVIKK